MVEIGAKFDRKLSSRIRKVVGIKEIDELAVLTRALAMYFHVIESGCDEVQLLHRGAVKKRLVQV